jgi:hypothetical protein
MTDFDGVMVYPKICHILVRLSMIASTTHNSALFLLHDMLVKLTLGCTNNIITIFVVTKVTYQGKLAIELLKHLSDCGV